MIQLGDYVKDSLTNYEGYAVSRQEELHGPISYAVESIENGKPSKVWFYEDRLHSAEKVLRREPGYATDSD